MKSIFQELLAEPAPYGASQPFSHEDFSKKRTNILPIIPTEAAHQQSRSEIPVGKGINTGLSYLPNGAYGVGIIQNGLLFNGNDHGVTGTEPSVFTEGYHIGIINTVPL